MSLRPALCARAGTPSPEVTGRVCRFPSAGVPRHALGCSPRGTCVGSRYGRPATLFTGSRALPTFAITHSPPSRPYGSPEASGLGRRDGAARHTRKRRAGFRPFRLDGAGILTCFPFGRLWLRTPLGPANPRLTNIAEETWPLRRSGFSPDYAATIARILVSARSTPPHGDASTLAERPPTESPCGVPGYRRSALAPSIFGAPSLGW